MTEKQLLHALQNIDGKYTAEAEERAANAVKPRIRRIVPITVTAAAAAACIGLTLFTAMPKYLDGMTIANSAITEQLDPNLSAAETITTTSVIAETVIQSEKNSTAQNNTTAKSTQTTGIDTAANSSNPVYIKPVSQNKSLIQVPDFTNMKWEDAKKLADSLKLALKRIDFDSTTAEGTVTSQSYQDVQVPAGTVIEVHVSNGGKHVTLNFPIPVSHYQSYCITLYDSNQQYTCWNTVFNASDLTDHTAELRASGRGEGDYTAVLTTGICATPTNLSDPNNNSSSYAILGTYHINFEIGTVQTISENIETAFNSLNVAYPKAETLVTVPDFTNKSWKEAQALADQNDLTVYKKEVESDAPKGTVVAQSTQIGMKVPELTTIILSVSAGENKLVHLEFPVPEKTYGIFTAKIYNNDRSWSDSCSYKAEYFYDDECSKKKLQFNVWGTGTAVYTLVLTNDHTDEQIEVGTCRVDFTNKNYNLIGGDFTKAFKSLTSTVPDFSAMRYEQAQAEASRLGFVVEKRYVSDADSEAGKFIEQNPPSGTVFGKGGTVYLTYATGKHIKSVEMQFQLPQNLEGTYAIYMDYDGNVSEEAANFTDYLHCEWYPFDPAYTNGIAQITVSGFDVKEVIAILIDFDNNRELAFGTYRIDFDKQTYENLTMIEGGLEAAFREIKK